MTIEENIAVLYQIMIVQDLIENLIKSTRDCAEGIQVLKYHGYKREMQLQRGIDRLAAALGCELHAYPFKSTDSIFTREVTFCDKGITYCQLLMADDYRLFQAKCAAPLTEEAIASAGLG